MKILKIENDKKLLKVVEAFFRRNIDAWKDWSFIFYDKVNARVGEKILDYFWEKEFGKRKKKKTQEDFDNEMKKYLKDKEIDDSEDFLIEEHLKEKEENEKTTNNNN